MSAAELARLREEVEALRRRAEAAEARIASVSGVTREELVKAEREACATLVFTLLNDGQTSLDHVVAAIRARGDR